MGSSFSRRDFLKLASIFALSSAAGAGVRTITRGPTLTGLDNRPNIIILLLDTLSARHLSLYGYPRQTSPNLIQLAQRANVYHRHHAAGNFTTPSTASLLGGVYPYAHRALHFNGMVKSNLTSRNIFSLLGGEYHKLAFAQNNSADILLYQYAADIDQHIKFGAYNLQNKTIYDNLFPNDVLTAYRSFDQYLFGGNLPGSLYFSHLRTLDDIADYNTQKREFRFRYPTDLPDSGGPPSAFILKSLFDGVIELLGVQPQPFFAYLHLYPPHEPYAPSKEFVGIFDGVGSSIPKKSHFFSKGESQQHLDSMRLRYDEYIAHTDAELGRLIGYLAESGLLSNSYLFVTSDHGELFERGVHGHNTPLLYETIIHIPLLVSAPGQNRRIDVHEPTSNIDLLPTILSITGHTIPDWCEGDVLPGLGKDQSSLRNIFSVEAKSNHALKALTKGSFALIHGNYKLIHYRGYKGHNGLSELYELENDPEELNDLYSAKPSIAKELQAELDARLEFVNRPYQDK